MEECVSMEHWAAAAGLALRLALVDSETKLSENGRTTMQGLVDSAPEGLYDDLPADIESLSQAVAFIEIIMASQ